MADATTLLYREGDATTVQMVADETQVVIPGDRTTVAIALEGIPVPTGGGEGGPPSGAAGGVLGGTYPNPSFAVDMATQAELNTEAATARAAETAAISTAAADATTKANAAQTAAATDATTKVAAEATARATAVTGAISTAAADATSKANTAQSAAISAAATDATSKVAAEAVIARAAESTNATAITTEATNRATAVTAAIATASSDATSKVAAEATARDTAIGVETTARSAADALLVPKTTTVNGHALSANVVVSASDLTTGTLPIGQVPTGTTSTTVPFGNDARFTDTRTPTDASVTDAKIATTLSPSKITGTAVVTADSRLSDTRTPTDATVTDAKIASTLSPSKITGTAVVQARTVNGHALSADVTVTATDLSLGNVTNTSDANKPVSTAQQTALNLKVDLAWQPAPIRKGATQTYQSQTALQTDSVLTFAIAANEVWKVKWIVWATGSSTADLTVGVNGPAGCVPTCFVNGPSNAYTGAAATNVQLQVPLTALNTAVGVYGTQAAVPVPVIIEGVITNGSTAGTVALQHAQSVSTAVDTVILAASTLERARIA